MYFVIKGILSLPIRDFITDIICSKYIITNGYCIDCSDLSCTQVECLDNYTWNGVEDCI